MSMNTIPVTIDLYIVTKFYDDDDRGIVCVETVVIGRDNAERVYSELVDQGYWDEVILADACVDNHGRVTEDQYVNHWISGRGETLRDGRETRREDTSPINYSWVPAED